MKKIVPILLLLCFLYFFAFPASLVQSVTDGLVTWYRTILPNMLPFAFLSAVLLESGAFDTVNRWLSPLLHLFFPALENGYFPIAAGFFFGFPFGSKITAELTASKKLDVREGNLICGISNNISPAFTVNIVQQTLFSGFAPTFATVFLLYFPPLFLGWLLGKAGFGGRTHKISKKTAPRFQFDFKIMDAAMMNAFETMLKLCGYIVLFSVISSALKTFFSAHPYVMAVGMNLLEISGGTGYLASLPIPVGLKYLIALPALSFGGISCLCQSISMMAGGNLSVSFYVKFKLCAAALTFALTFLYLAGRAYFA